MTVNCIHPGLTRTEGVTEMLAARAAKRGITPEELEAADYTEGRGNSIGRMVDAREIAHLAVFLCSDKSWAVNGETIAADGAATLRSIIERGSAAASAPRKPRKGAAWSPERREIMVRVSDTAGVRTIALNRPDALNAFNGQQYDDLTDALIAARDDAACRVVVLTGTGRAFSAGADLSEMASRGPQPRHGFGGMLDVLFDFPKPFVVAINGLGVGVGATIIGLADFAFMAESARLRCPFSELGLVAEAASTQTFPALMGRQQAMWFLMAAEWMGSAECKAAGLVLDVFRTTTSWIPSRHGPGASRPCPRTRSPR